MSVIAEFAAEIARVEARLRAIRAERTTREIRPGGWRGTEVLGHLIDSALNNHQRFVRAALEGTYAGPGYHQPGWVQAHGYAEVSWADLLALWRSENSLLTRVVTRIPEERLSAPCRVGDKEPTPLAAVIEGYLQHLLHHLAQLERLNAA
mgnify:CR=1 FL=1